MKISLQDPNHRLLIFLAAIIGLIGLLAVDRFSYPPGGSGIMTIVLWFLLLGIAGAMLSDILPFGKKSAPREYPDTGPDRSPKGAINPWAQEANRALLVWCLCLAYEILIVMFFPVLIDSYAISGTIGLPAVALIAIIGIPVVFLVMNKYEIKYKTAVKALDPDLAADLAAGFSIYADFVGPRLFLSSLFIVVYSVFLGWFFGDRIRPVLLPFLPAYVSPLLNPLLSGVTLALVAAPALIYVIYRRRE